MNREDIINTLKNYNLDTSKYIVIAGAAMTMLGLKEQTHDIDIAVTKDYYEYLKDNYDCKLEWCNEDNDVYYIDGIINFGVNYYNGDHLIIDEIQVQKPEDIIKIKQIFGREKDMEDIKLIKKYMGDKNEFISTGLFR